MERVRKEKEVGGNEGKGCRGRGREGEEGEGEVVRRKVEGDGKGVVLLDGIARFLSLLGLKLTVVHVF